MGARPPRSTRADTLFTSTALFRSDEDMAGLIESVTALEAVIGRTPPAVNLKVIDHIDAGARRWLAASPLMFAGCDAGDGMAITLGGRSEEHTSELQSLMRISYAVFCLKKKK